MICSRGNHLLDLNLAGAEDPQIFRAACSSGSVVMTKDRDFVDLVRRFRPPPQVLWITSGNTSNATLIEILESTFQLAHDMLLSGEAIVQIKG
ncbi:MAG: DUF5615 family PIN-like protein [Acidobacteriota bacterium]